MAEMQLFAAFAAPKDDLFYLGEDAEDWQLMN